MEIIPSPLLSPLSLLLIFQHLCLSKNRQRPSRACHGDSFSTRKRNLDRRFHWGTSPCIALSPFRNVAVKCCANLPDTVGRHELTIPADTGSEAGEIFAPLRIHAATLPRFFTGSGTDNSGAATGVGATSSGRSGGSPTKPEYACFVGLRGCIGNALRVHHALCDKHCGRRIHSG